MVTGQGLDGHTRLVRAGEVGMARFVPGPMDQSGPGPCVTEDLGLHGDWLTPVLTDQPARSARGFRRRNLGAHGAPLVPAAGRQLPLTPSSLVAEDKSAILRVGS